MKKRYQVLLHVLMWLVLLAFSLWMHFNVDRMQIPLPWLALDVTQTFLFHLALFYFNWFVLLPRLLAKGNVLLYALAVVVSLLVFAGVRAPIEIFMKETAAEVVPSLAAQIKKHPQMLYYSSIMIQIAVTAIMNIFLSSSLKVTGDYLRNERRRKELELQQTTTELELLKAQVNPHFLFNTLNNIYSLAYQNSPSTADSILKLSLLLRYQLYETNTAVVPLEREVEHMDHLLDLHRLRLTDPSLLTMEVHGHVDKVSVPPMLLMPLVENMFKHGLTTAPMHVELTVSETDLTFTTTNRTKAKGSQKDSFGGIGLQNLRRRLELLYPGAHDFSTQEQDQEFTARLLLTRLS